MDLVEAETRISTLMAQRLMLRDFVIWLLVREIGRTTSHQETIRVLTEFVDRRLSVLPSATTEDLQIEAIFREESDTIIAGVSKVLAQL